MLNCRIVQTTKKRTQKVVLEILCGALFRFTLRSDTRAVLSCSKCWSVNFLFRISVRLLFQPRLEAPSGVRLTGISVACFVSTLYCFFISGGFEKFRWFLLITLTTECAHHNKEDYKTKDPARIILRCDCCAENFLHMALLSAENLHMALPLLCSGCTAAAA